MVMIKWIDDKPYVYKSKVFDSGEQKDVYQGTYKEYRQKNPGRTFNDDVKLSTIAKWIDMYPDRIKLLLLIDAEVGSIAQH